MPGEIGDRLRQLRDERGISREKLGAAVGVSGGQLYRLEVGRNAPSATLVARLCEELGVSADWLLFGRGRLPVECLEPESPAWDAFMDSELGSSARPAEIEVLKSIRGVPVTVHFLQAMLLLVRQQLTPAQASETAARMSAAEESAKKKGL